METLSESDVIMATTSPMIVPSASGGAMCVTLPTAAMIAERKAGTRSATAGLDLVGAG